MSIPTSSTESVLMISMGVSVDGYICDRDGQFAWAAPDDELFGAHLERVSRLAGCFLGRKLYQAMLVWENDPALRATQLYAAFAEVWTALPKVVFSRTLTQVQGQARLATGSVADEIRDTMAARPGEYEIGGADLAGQALQLDLVDQLNLFRYPVFTGGGTPLFPDLPTPIPLRQTDSRSFLAGQVQFEQYRRDH